MILVLESPGNLLAMSWKLLGSFWLQIWLVSAEKIAIIVATRYVFLAAGMPKCYPDRASATDP